MQCTHTRPQRKPFCHANIIKIADLVGSGYFVPNISLGIYRQTELIIETALPYICLPPVAKKGVFFAMKTTWQYHSGIQNDILFDDNVSCRLEPNTLKCVEQIWSEFSLFNGNSSEISKSDFSWTNTVLFIKRNFFSLT